MLLLNYVSQKNYDGDVFVMEIFGIIEVIKPQTKLQTGINKLHFLLLTLTLLCYLELCKCKKFGFIRNIYRIFSKSPNTLDVFSTFCKQRIVT